MDWNQKARANIIPLSQEQGDLEIALREWLYTGTVIDHIFTSQTCHLCGKTNLRYHFEIKNKLLNNALFVGSSCILRFNIAIYKENGQILEGKKERQKKLDTAIKEYQKESVLNSLRQLWRIDIKNQEAIHDLAIDFKEKNKFKPGELLFLFQRMTNNDIRYEETYFKLILRSDSERIQMFQMSEDEKDIVMARMTRKQRDSYGRWQKRYEQEERVQKHLEKQRKGRQEYRAPLSKPKVLQSRPVARCLLCGEMTANWWFYDGQGACKCNRCKKKPH